MSTDDPRDAAVDVLARTYISDCLRDALHHYMGLRKLPKADLDAIRERAWQIETGLRPTHTDFEKAYDELRFGGTP